MQGGEYLGVLHLPPFNLIYFCKINFLYQKGIREYYLIWILGVSGTNSILILPFGSYLLLQLVAAIVLSSLMASFILYNFI